MKKKEVSTLKQENIPLRLSQQDALAGCPGYTQASAASLKAAQVQLKSASPFDYKVDQSQFTDFQRRQASHLEPEGATTPFSIEPVSKAPLAHLENHEQKEQQLSSNQVIMETHRHQQHQRKASNRLLAETTTTAVADQFRDLGLHPQMDTPRAGFHASLLNKDGSQMYQSPLEVDISTPNNQQTRRSMHEHAFVTRSGQMAAGCIQAFEDNHENDNPEEETVIASDPTMSKSRILDQGTPISCPYSGAHSRHPSSKMASRELSRQSSVLSSNHHKSHSSSLIHNSGQEGLTNAGLLLQNEQRQQPSYVYYQQMQSPMSELIATPEIEKKGPASATTESPFLYSSLKKRTPGHYEYMESSYTWTPEEMLSLLSTMQDTLMTQIQNLEAAKASEQQRLKLDESEEDSALSVDEVLKQNYRQVDLLKAFIGMSNEIQEQAEALNEKNIRTEQKSKYISQKYHQLKELHNGTEKQLKEYEASLQLLESELETIRFSSTDQVIAVKQRMQGHIDILEEERNSAIDELKNLKITMAEKEFKLIERLEDNDAKVLNLNEQLQAQKAENGHLKDMLLQAQSRIMQMQEELQIAHEQQMAMDQGSLPPEKIQDLVDYVQELEADKEKMQKKIDELRLKFKDTKKKLRDTIAVLGLAQSPCRSPVRRSRRLDDSDSKQQSFISAASSKSGASKSRQSPPFHALKKKPLANSWKWNTISSEGKKSHHSSFVQLMPVIEEQVSDSDPAVKLEHGVKFDFRKESIEQKLKKIMKINKITFATSDEPLCDELQGEELKSLSLGHSPDSRTLDQKKAALNQELLDLSKIGDDSSEIRRPIHQRDTYPILRDASSIQKSRMYQPSQGEAQIVGELQTTSKVFSDEDSAFLRVESVASRKDHLSFLNRSQSIEGGSFSQSRPKSNFLNSRSKEPQLRIHASPCRTNQASGAVLTNENEELKVPEAILVNLEDSQNLSTFKDAIQHNTSSNRQQESSFNTQAARKETSYRYMVRLDTAPPPSERSDDPPIKVAPFCPPGEGGPRDLKQKGPMFKVDLDAPTEISMPPQPQTPDEFDFESEASIYEAEIENNCSDSSEAKSLSRPIKRKKRVAAHSSSSESRQLTHNDTFEKQTLQKIDILNRSILDQTNSAIEQIDELTKELDRPQFGGDNSLVNFKKEDDSPYVHTNLIPSNASIPANPLQANTMYKPRKSSNSFEFMRDLGNAQQFKAGGSQHKVGEGSDKQLQRQLIKQSLSGSSEFASAEGGVPNQPIRLRIQTPHQDLTINDDREEELNAIFNKIKNVDLSSKIQHRATFGKDQPRMNLTQNLEEQDPIVLDQAVAHLGSVEDQANFLMLSEKGLEQRENSAEFGKVPSSKKSPKNEGKVKPRGSIVNTEGRRPSSKLSKPPLYSQTSQKSRQRTPSPENTSQSHDPKAVFDSIPNSSSLSKPQRVGGASALHPVHRNNNPSEPPYFQHSHGSIMKTPRGGIALNSQRHATDGKITVDGSSKLSRGFTLHAIRCDTNLSSDEEDGRIYAAGYTEPLSNNFMVTAGSETARNAQIQQQRQTDYFQMFLNQLHSDEMQWQRYSKVLTSGNKFSSEALLKKMKTGATGQSNPPGNPMAMTGSSDQIHLRKPKLEDGPATQQAPATENAKKNVKASPQVVKVRKVTKPQTKK